MAIDTALYTAQATSTGGRTGTTKSSDGRVSLNLSTPKGLGGDDGPGTNPEQLFAAGYSACFAGAFGVTVAMKVSVPGMDKAAAEALVKAAHEVCPYSNATRGNLDVKIAVV